jgi:alpha-mannosidase
MATRELILLSPYRFPAKNSVSLGEEEVAAFLNGHSALWHPAALAGAAGPPRIESSYEHDQPRAGQIFAVPDRPPLVLPDDWTERVRNAGAVSFQATPDRPTTFSSVIAGLRSLTGESSKMGPLLELEDETVAPFLGLGFGYRVIETLFEAMEHENVLSTTDFWLDIQSAIAATTDAEACRQHLRAAAERLLAAREVLYPVSIHLIDMGLVDDRQQDAPFPASLAKGNPFNLIASAITLEKLAQERPESFAAVRAAVKAGSLEVCGGAYVEREDALLPIESQLWNLHFGLAGFHELLNQRIQVFARKRFAAHPQLPSLIQHLGLKRALLIAFDDSVLPTYRTTIVNWSSTDGKQLDVFTRMPYPAEAPQTFFHLAHHLHRTIAEDHAATLAILHRNRPAAPWYGELLELSRLAPVFGQWRTLSQYFDEVMAGEYAAAISADQFHGDYLTERINAQAANPVGWFAEQSRARRRLDAAWTWCALHRGVAGQPAEAGVCGRLSRVENAAELAKADSANDLAELEKEAAHQLAARLLARAQANQPGYLILNPCSFARRAVVEWSDMARPLPLEGPLKIYQTDGDRTRAVIEVPALGFAWLPKSGAEGAPMPATRMRLAEANTVRNEFFEAEVDRDTGGLRALRDHRTRMNRIGQQLIFNPGSRMRAAEIKVASSGPAFGEVVSEGDIIDAQDRILARFRQSFRAWLGRPVLELGIEIQPVHLAEGYPWHAYYGARFAWRDERAILLRSVNGASQVTHHARPETPDYLELRLGGQTTTLFTCGLPFHQRNGGRMLDVILVAQGEETRSFELALALDRDYPWQTALGLISPVTIVPTTKGPPFVGQVGWLFHLDAPSLLLTGLRPDPRGADAVLFRLLDCQNQPVSAELRCVRNPKRAHLVDGNGEVLADANVLGDAVQFEVPSGGLVELRVEFA